MKLEEIKSMLASMLGDAASIVKKMPRQMQESLIDMYFESMVIDYSLRNTFLITTAKQVMALAALPADKLQRMLIADGDDWAKAKEAAPSEATQQTDANHTRVINAMRAFLTVKPALEKALREEGVSFSMEEVLGLS